MGIATDIVVQHRARESTRKGGRAANNNPPWRDEFGEDELEAARDGVRKLLYHEVSVAVSTGVSLSFFVERGSSVPRCFRMSTENLKALRYRVHNIGVTRGWGMGVLQVPKAKNRDRKMKKDALHALTTGSVGFNESASSNAALLSGEGTQPGCLPMQQGNRIMPIPTEEQVRMAGMRGRAPSSHPRVLSRRLLLTFTDKSNYCHREVTYKKHI
jgi:hypothetical protein